MQFFMESVLTPVNKQGFAWHLAHRQPYQPPASTILPVECSSCSLKRGQLSGFSLGRLHMGGDKALMGGLMRWDIDLMGEEHLIFIDYIIN